MTDDMLRLLTAACVGAAAMCLLVLLWLDAFDAGAQAGLTAAAIVSNRG